MRVHMENKELVECLIPHWKGERHLFYSFFFFFFFCVVINVLICIGANIKLDTFRIISISMDE